MNDVARLEVGIASSGVYVGVRTGASKRSRNGVPHSFLDAKCGTVSDVALHRKSKPTDSPVPHGDDTTPAIGGSPLIRKRLTDLACFHLAVAFALALVSLEPAPSFAQQPKRKAKTQKPSKPMVRSIVVEKSLENSEAQGYFDDAVGMVNAKRYTEAAAKFEEALPLLRSEANRRGEASVLNNIGVAYALGGDHAKAVGFYQQSLDIATQDSLDETQASVLYNLGVATYKLDKDPALILDYFGRALAVYQKLGNRTGEADTLFNMGQVHQWNGDAGKAREYYNKSLQVRTQ